jgi:predicted lipoprotein with Yx(FWY)xxD motif
MPEQPTARQRIERAFHVSFKLPAQAAELLDAYRDQVLTEAAELLYAVDYDEHNISLCCRDCAMESATAVLLAARTAPDAP